MEKKDKDLLLRNLANQIKELRLKKGVSQQDAFNDTGIHFGRIEQGKQDISFTTLIRISKYFEVSVNNLF